MKRWRQREDRGTADRFQRFSALFDPAFNVMVLPAADLFDGQPCVHLQYPYADAHAYTCIRRELPDGPLTVRACKRAMKEGTCVLIQAEEIGTLLFTDHVHSDLFLVLQRHFRSMTGYVFCANATGGYFKLLKEGRIRRKIASFLCMDGIRNLPQTKGAPCSWELERGQVYQVDPQAKHMKDMLKGFGREEVLSLMDHYIGLQKLYAAKIERIEWYDLMVDEKAASCG